MPAPPADAACVSGAFRAAGSCAAVMENMSAPTKMAAAAKASLLHAQMKLFLIAFNVPA
jgi:hypothetical protein